MRAVTLFEASNKFFSLSS